MKAKSEPDNITKAAATVGANLARRIFETGFERELRVTEEALAAMLGVAAERGMRNVLRRQK